MSWFWTVKLWLIENADLARDALHIYVGLGILFVSCLVFRWPLRALKPWLLVLAAAVAGEIWDLIDSARLKVPIYPWANWKDLWNTMFWPTAIVALARWTQVFQHESGDSGEETLE